MEKTQKKKILIIDDVPEVIRTLKNFFSELGWYEVLSVINGETGINVALRETPDLIISDIAMPGETGLSVLTTIREHQTLKDIPVIIFSGIHDEEFKKDSIRLGATDFFDKPEDLLKLFKRARELLGVS